MITNQYIKEFFEKKERQTSFRLKTRYGKSLPQKYGMNEKKVEQWITARKRSVASSQ